jgi:hypothetical protein
MEGAGEKERQKENSGKKEGKNGEIERSGK